MVTGQGPTLLEQLARGASGVATVAKAVLPIVSAITQKPSIWMCHIQAI